MIKSIELKNWKTHKHTKLDFSKGTNILIGQMGSGKSSIMDAISFALFGTFPSIQHRRISVSKLVRNKPMQEQNGYVKLEFNFDGTDYSIKREISFDGKSSATIEKNGEYLQSQPQRVTEEIERILKVDYDLFSKAVYSEQNKLDYFLDLRASDRKNQIDGLLGLDKFALAQENTTSLVNRIKDMVTDTERIANEFDIDKAKSDLGSLRSEMERLSKEKLETESKLSGFVSAKAKSEHKSNTLKEQYGRKLAIAKELEGLKSRSSLLEAEIRKIESTVKAERSEVSKELAELVAEFEKLRKEDSKLSEEESKLNKIIATSNAEIDRANKDKAEKERISKKISGLNKESIDKSISSCNSLIEQFNLEVAKSKARISEAELQVKELEKHISKCPICERELDEHMKVKLLEEKKKLILENKKSSTEHTAILEKRKIELKELTVQMTDLTVADQQLKRYLGIEEKLEQNKKSLAAAIQEYDKMKAVKEKGSKSILASTERIQKLKSIIESLDRKDRYITENMAATESTSKKKKEFDEITVDQKEIDEIQEELVLVNSEISRHKANLEASTKYIKDKELQIKEKNSEIERINRIKEDVAKKRIVIDNLSKFKISLAETQSLLRSQLINSINGIMHEVWQNLYPYGDYQSLTLDSSDDDYTLKVKTIVNNEYLWEDVESIASGRERSTASLAMRIAFSLVLVPNLKWLILDEPTHNIDREGLSKFVQVFGETLPNIVDQVFIITHDEVLKQVSNANIYSFNRNKGENRETEVTQI